MIPPHLQSLLDATRGELGPFARQGRVVATTASTNDDALAWAAAGAPEGAWIVAGAQTAGRGRRGRVVGVAARAPASTCRSCSGRAAAGATAGRHDPAMSLLTVMAGVAAVRRSTTRRASAPTLKWPNDVVVERAGARRRASWPASWPKA